MLRKLLLVVMSILLVVVTILLVTSLSAASEEHVEETTKKKEIVISAAASLQDSLEKIARQYEEEHPTVDLLFNYGASGTLQKQIEQGAPADLFFSAGDKQMSALVDGGFIIDHIELLKNELVVVVPSNTNSKLTSIAQLTGSEFKKVAVGQPESVPAGQYAHAVLTTENVWNALQSKLVFAKDVHQVLSYVETGNVDAGFVYRTDALTSQKVKIELTVDSFAHKPIIYPVGIVKGSKIKDEAIAFYNYVQTKTASDVFTSYGFLLP